MARTRPNAGLFDVNLSEGDGIELAEAVLRDRPDQPTLLYAGFENDPLLADVLSSGVRGVPSFGGRQQVDRAPSSRSPRCSSSFSSATDAH
jgi:DNA-binding NarL/FixJ family response regulator